VSKCRRGDIASVCPLGQRHPCAACSLFSARCPIGGVACGLPLHPDMTSMGSDSAAQVRELLPLIERRDSAVTVDASVALASRAAGLRRRRGKPRRFGLLRLAPRLVVLTGSARHPNWPAVAAGIGSAFTGCVDPDDAPWCA
jgi:hypothetical protein